MSSAASAVFERRKAECSVVDVLAALQRLRDVAPDEAHADIDKALWRAHELRMRVEQLAEFEG